MPEDNPEDTDFLAEFDKRQAANPTDANNYLYHWICNHQNSLLEQLREGRPVLKFHSHHPDNPFPDHKKPQLKGPDNNVYLLSKPEDVRYALQHWSMEPHRYSGEFILAKDEREEHANKRRTLVHKLQDSDIAERIDAAIALTKQESFAWRSGPGLEQKKAIANEPGNNVRIDIKQYARRVALHFTWQYFGLPFNQIFVPQGEDNSRRVGYLEGASELAFREYIWKIHARHFERQAPDDPKPAIVTVKGLIAQGTRIAPSNTVIGRFRTDPGAFRKHDGEPDNAAIGANVLGCIQGLIDNVTISACNAINQLMKEAGKARLVNRDGTDTQLSLIGLRQAAKDADLNRLHQYILSAHQIDTPSPFLPRYALPVHGHSSDYQGVSESVRELNNVQVACALNSGASTFSSIQPGTPDIRMGYKTHDCIGRFLGDELVLQIIKSILLLDDLRDISNFRMEFDKDWAWIVTQCDLCISPQPNPSPKTRPNVPDSTAASDEEHPIYIRSGIADRLHNGNGLVANLIDGRVVNLSQLTAREVASLPAPIFKSLSSAQLGSLTPEQARSLTPEQAVVLDGRLRAPDVSQEHAELKEAVGKQLSYFAISTLTRIPQHRPTPYSLWSPDPGTKSILDYTTWPGLTDRSFTARHLEPVSEAFRDSLTRDDKYVSAQSYGRITGLFKYEEKIAHDALEQSRSSFLFPLFAQWFTDSFLATNSVDRRRNNSTHQVDMSQIYGRHESVTNMIRSHVDGKLRSETIEGNEFPPRLFLNSDLTVKDEFSQLPQVVSGYVNHELNRWRDNLDRSRYYMATGLAQGNGTFGMVALNTLFLREHNKICEDLARKNPLWRDEQLFQTARMIVTLLEIKIVVEEYINHISAAPDGDDPIKPRQRVFKFDNSFAEQQRWYRTNHIALEFDLLYRWHCFVPKRIRLQNEKETEKEYALSEFINYNDPLINSGLDGVLIAASKQRINTPGLFSTPDELLGAEYAALKMSRDFRLQPYNNYRAAFGLQPMTEFHDLRASKEVTERLKDIYEEDINKLDFLVGLYAERASETRLFGDLMTRMVAYDAFTQVLTNPLVSKNILTKKTITEVGIERLKNTNSLNDIWQRNKDASPKIGDDLQTISMDINGQQA